MTRPSWHPAGRWLRLPEFAGGVHVVSLGQGPDLVLLHGLLQSSWAWRGVLPLLAAQFRVHAVCLPGFGWSAKPDVAYDLPVQSHRLQALLGALGVQAAAFVGNSLGGSLALQLAVDAPERVRRLMLVAPVGPGVHRAGLAARCARPAAAPLLALPGMGAALRALLQWGAYPQLRVDDAVLGQFLAPLRDPGGKVAALRAAHTLPSDLARLQPQLSRLQLPVRVLWGRRDRVLPLSHARWLLQPLPTAQFTVYDDVGHCPMEEAPARLAHDLIGFLLP
jgi:hypothetical protein